MNYEPIDWDTVPDVMSKDQFYKLCHISKSTARYLLQTGKVPCQYTGKKTRAIRSAKRMCRLISRERESARSYICPKTQSAKRNFRP